MRTVARSNTTVSLLAACGALLALAAGCTAPGEYVRNGFKVGPNFRPPPAPVVSSWLESNNPNILSQPPRSAAWWQTFRDPVLDTLVSTAYRQNLTLRVACLRILEARAQRNIVVGELFPQSQQVFGSYMRKALSSNVTNPAPPPRFVSEWQSGAALAWELDFWGRFRRAIEAADADVGASVADYDDALVLLLAEVAQQYIDLRTTEQRLQYAAKNVVIQAGSAYFADLRYDNNRGKGTRLDVTQAHSNLSQTLAFIPPLETARQQAANQLCILLGTTPGRLDPLLVNPSVDAWLKKLQAVLAQPDLSNLEAMRRRMADIQELRKKPVEKVIPTAPAEVAIGIPADLLRRRPDIRRAEWQVAAQSARIGVAVSDLYPHFAISGTIFLDAARFQDLFKSGSMAGNVGPSFQWDVLNYGRFINNIRVQDIRFQEQVVLYQNTVLQANVEAENAIAGFLNAQRQVRVLAEGTNWAEQSLDLAQEQYDAGKTDFNRVFNIQQLLTQQEDQSAVAQGAVAQNLVLIYRAIGGGWQIRCAPAAAQGERRPEAVPAPAPAAGRP
jgi:outer membrane protein TolC